LRQVGEQLRVVGNVGRHPAFYAVLAYVLLSMLLTWPLIFQLDSVLFGDYGDARGVLWWLWAKTNGLLDAPTNQLIAAPFGIPVASGFSTPVSEWLSIILARLSNEIVAYNLYVLLAFPLTAIATYFLLDRLLRNIFAAFVGGLIFGFCPAVVMQAAGGHAAFAFNAFIPLFLLALFYNRSQRTHFSAFYVAASFALITLTALYSGYFAIYIAIFFVVFDLLNSKGEDKHAIFWNYLYGAIFAIGLILPFVYKAIYQQIVLVSDALAKTGQIRDFNELVVYSSRPWEFFIPSIDHPILGDFIYEFARAHLHGSNTPEQTLYLGLVPIGILLTGIVLVVRGKFKVDHRTYFLFFAFGALWVYFLSLPPLISIGSVNVPTVSYFAYYVAPMFRVYARFGIFVNFFVACAAAVVLTHLYQRMTRVRYYTMLAVLLPLLVFEYWSVPPGYALAVDRPPEVYQWLAIQPVDVIVAEYPMTSSDESAFYTYLFWQRIHKKKLVNGASPDNARAWALFEKVKDLDNPATPTLLKAMGVKYVIVHTKMYAEGPIPEPIKRYFPVPVSSSTYNGGNMPSVPFPLKLSKTFGTDMVFSLDAVPFELAAKEILPPVNGAR
jgi:hypothetical protein